MVIKTLEELLGLGGPDLGVFLLWGWSVPHGMSWVLYVEILIAILCVELIRLWFLYK